MHTKHTPDTANTTIRNIYLTVNFIHADVEIQILFR
jgi:hypothetical protein